MWAATGSECLVHESNSQSEEALLYSLRSVYNRALSMLHRSSRVGDACWAECRDSLVKMKSQLSNLISTSGSTGVMFHEYRRLLFLANKNLARVHSQETGTTSPRAAFLSSLEACSLVSPEENPTDGALFLRTANLALKMGDIWSCNLIIAYHKNNIGDLFHQAVAHLEQSAQAKAMEELSTATGSANYWIESKEWLPCDVDRDISVVENPNLVQIPSKESIKNAFTQLIVFFSKRSMGVFIDDARVLSHLAGFVFVPETELHVPKSREENLPTESASAVYETLVQSSEISEPRRSNRQPARKIRDDDAFSTGFVSVSSQTSSSSSVGTFLSAVQDSVKYLGQPAHETIESPEEMLEKLSSDSTPFFHSKPDHSKNDLDVSETSRTALLGFYSKLARGSQDSHDLSFIRLCALFVEDICNFKGAQLFSNEDLALVPLAVMKCWHRILLSRNFEYDASFVLLDVSQRVFLCECAADALQSFEHYIMTSEDEDVLRRIAKATLNSYFFGWFDTQELNSKLLNNKRLLVTRQIWLLLTHAAVGSDNLPYGTISNETGSDMINSLSDFLSTNGPLRLPHCRVWGEIDVKHLNILSSFFQENLIFADLERTHAPTHDWIACVRNALIQNDNIHGMITMSISRRQTEEESLVCQICNVCTILDDTETWMLCASRVLNALQILFMMRRHQPNDDFFPSWVTSLVTVMSNSFPKTHPAANSDEVRELYNSVVKLLMIGYVYQQDIALFASTEFLRSVTAWVWQDECVSLCAVSCMCCIDDLAAKSDTDMIFGVSNLLEALTSLGAFTCRTTSPSQLEAYIRTLLFYNDRRGTENAHMLQSCISALLSCCIFLDSVKSATKLSLMKIYFDCYTASKQILTDGGRALEHFTNESLKSLQEGLNVPFHVSELTSREIFEYCTLVGNCYNHLYNLPLIVSPNNDSVDHDYLPISPKVADQIFLFYQYCVGVGRCAKSERRSCLTFLLQQDVFAIGPRSTSTFNSLSMFLLSGTFDPTLNLFTDSLNPGMSNYLKAYNSIYYECLTNFRDAPIPSSRDGAPDVAFAEKRVLKTIELCLLDLTFNIKRSETWVVLHNKLTEYLHMLCDEIGGICIPGLFPKALLDFDSETITLGDLLGGNLRSDYERGNLLRNLFESENDGIGSTENLVAAAWGFNTDIHISILFLLLDLRSAVLRMLNRVSIVLDNSDIFTEHQRANCFIVHGLSSLTISQEATMDLLYTRHQRSIALSSLERALPLWGDSGGLSDCSKVHALCMVVRLRWELYCDLSGIVTTFERIRDVFEKEKDAARVFWKSLRVSLTNELGMLLVEASLHFLLPTDREKNVVPILEATNILAGLQRSGTTQQVEDLWDVLLLCFSQFRECQRLDPQDFRASYALSASIRHLSMLQVSCAVPLDENFVNRLRSDHSIQLDNLGALMELSKLFEKKRPQVVSMWVPEKPADGWDCQLKKMYEFENRRRTIFNVFFELAELCDDLNSALSVLYTSYISKNQTATVRYMVDSSVRGVMNIIGRKLSKYQDELGTVYDILVHVRARVSVSTSNKISKILCALHARLANRGTVKSSLQQALTYCHGKWAMGSATLNFQKRFNEGKKKRTSSAAGLEEEIAR